MFLFLLACGSATAPTTAGETLGNLTVESSYLGNVIETNVYNGDQQIGMSWDPIEMEPGTVNVNVGDARINDNLTDAPDDLPLLHEMPDGSYIGFAAQDATVNANEDTTVNFEGGKVFWGEYVCSVDVCLGDVCDPTVTDPSTSMHIDSNLDLAIDGSSSVLDWLDLSVSGDQFVSNAEVLNEVLSSNISANEFSLEILDSADRTQSFNCIKQ